MTTKRKLDICVLSDIHLGTIGCNASSLLNYLQSIDTDLLILNGDVIDIWDFKKSQFGDVHRMILGAVIKMMNSGTKVVYITGNHDEMLRRYSGFKLNNFHLVDNYIFSKDGKVHWAFHGDVFDRTTKGPAKLIAKLGGKGYDLLILFNRFMNKLLKIFGMPRMSISKRVKEGVKYAVSWIDNFEKTAAELAIEQGYDYVLCGHIHAAKIEEVNRPNGSVVYMNSGDWIENLTALEYAEKEWSIHNASEIEAVEGLFKELDLQEIHERMISEIMHSNFQKEVVDLV